VSNPKAFISYSWTSPDHVARVLEIATHLRESGVDVVIDKWDLREGHDAHAFMEQMVTNPEIRKVILVCDKAYAAKADGRSGGVGTETQILTPELYGKQTQEKFVAVVFEREEDGKPYLPAYYRSRIFIDFSDPTIEADSFDQLLRWIYDQPLHVKPELGKKPTFLAEEASGTIRLATASFQRRAVEAAKSGRENAEAFLTEYLSTLATELEKFRSTRDPDGDFDDKVVASIEAFLPYRDQAIEVFQAFALFRDTPGARLAFHRFFEQLIPYLSRPETITSWTEGDFDNFQFIIHELLLYAVATLIRHERFEAVATLLQEFFIYGQSEHGNNMMVSYDVFRAYLRTLEHRNSRLKSNRISLRADMLHARAQNSGVPFRYLAEADFLLFIRRSIERSDDWHGWFPETLIHVARSNAPFEIFARSRSTAYFDKMKQAIGVNSKQDLVALAEQFRTGARSVPKWQSAFSSINPIALMALDEIATKP
jgi:hypothetical protein